MSRQLTYLFDGHCVLCAWGVQYVLKHEKSSEMRFVAILSEEGRELAIANDIDPETPQSFLYIDGDRIFQKSDAALALVKEVGGPARYLYWTRFVPRPIRDFVYAFIAKHRYRIFGQTDSCYVPHPDEKHRFVLT